MKKIYLTLLTALLLSCAAQAQTTVSNNMLRFPNGGNTTTYMKEDYGISLFGNNVRPIKISNTSLMVGYTSSNQDFGIGNVLISNRVGVGTTSPIAQLHMVGSGGAGGSVVVQNTSPNSYSGMNMLNEQGDLGASFQYGNSEVNELSNTFFFGNRSGGATHIISGLYPQILMTVLSEGNVGIGITNPQNKLDVNGTIHSKKVTIDMNGWSDYVFEKTYTLPTLREVKNYIDENHHLLGLPSEKEMVKNGLDVAEMNKTLTKKVEELTLYILKMNEEIEKLKTQVNTTKAH